jgi:hypothetical protein
MAGWDFSILHKRVVPALGTPIIKRGTLSAKKFPENSFWGYFVKNFVFSNKNSCCDLNF